MPKQLIIHPSVDEYEIIETPIPVPEDKEVIIKVAAAGLNPKDWKFPFWKHWPHNSGVDVAGVVHSVGKDVYEFKPGDRVAALHETGKPNGSYAEYSVAPDYTTFHIPEHISFEEASTVPLTALTAAVALYLDMKLPVPYSAAPAMPGAEAEAKAKTPLVIYGITSACGAFAAKLARLSGISPIIGIAGRAGDYAQALADYVVDYREGEDAVVSGVEQALLKEGLGDKAPYVFDAISEGGTLETTLRFVKTDGGVVSTLLPPALFARDGKNFAYPPGVKGINSAGPTVHFFHQDFGYVWSRFLSRLLADGRLKPHPHEVAPGGFHGVSAALKKLRDGKASAVKYVCRLEDTDYSLPTPKITTSKEPPSKPHPLSNFPFPLES